MSGRRNPPIDREVLELLSDEPELLAVADAIAATQPRQRRRPWRPRRLRIGLGAAIILLAGSGLGFGFGTWFTPSSGAENGLHGLGFLPTAGWTVVQSETASAPKSSNAIASNIPLDAADESSDFPYATLRRLPPNGVVIVARLAPRGDEHEDSRFPLRTLPLRVADALPADAPPALADASLVPLRVRGGVGGYNVEARVFFGSPPSPDTVAAVDEQLQRLVVAPDGVTLTVQPRVIRNSGERLTIFGSVASGKAGERVVVQFRQCGLYPIQFRDAFETTTRAGGGFSFDELRPFNLGISGAFRAVWGDSVSEDVPVQQRASVYLTRVRGGRFQVRVAGLVPFWRRQVLLQRFERARGVWITVRSLMLTEQLGGAPGPAPPFSRTSPVLTQTAPFRPVVPKGTTIRAMFPLSQARPCYLAGVSKLVRT